MNIVELIVVVVVVVVAANKKIKLIETHFRFSTICITHGLIGSYADDISG